MENKKTKKFRYKNQLGLSDYIYFGVDSDNVDLENGKTLTEKIESLDQNIEQTNKDIPLRNSQLENDSEYITKEINNLTNYYTKNDTYTKDEVNTMIGNLPILKIEKVDALPTTNIDTQTIYLVPNQNINTQDKDDKLIEYMYINGVWEIIGDTRVDFSGYYKKTETDNLLKQKQDVTTAWNTSNLVIGPTAPAAPTSGYKIWIDTSE